jgi:hypothetical protein
MDIASSIATQIIATDMMEVGSRNDCLLGQPADSASTKGMSHNYPEHASYFIHQFTNIHHNSIQANKQTNKQKQVGNIISI